MIQTTSFAVENLLPSALIAYLWTLTEENLFPSAQAFLLSRQMLAGKPLQEIRHVIGGQTVSVHKVFGFDPVEVYILVTTQAGERQMEVRNQLEVTSA